MFCKSLLGICTMLLVKEFLVQGELAVTVLIDVY